jgi:hypothetical protein
MINLESLHNFCNKKDQFKNRLMIDKDKENNLQSKNATSDKKEYKTDGEKDENSSDVNVNNTGVAPGEDPALAPGADADAASG